MSHAEVTLIPLTEDDREDFIRDNQGAFKHSALIEFGERDDNLNDEGEIISRSTIEGCIDSPKSEAYRITMDGKKVLTRCSDSSKGWFERSFLPYGLTLQHP